MNPVEYFFNKKAVVALSLFLLLSCSVKVSYAEKITIKKNLKIGVGYSLLDADENGILRLDKNGIRNLDLEVDQEKYKLKFDLDFDGKVDENITERAIIMADISSIIENIAGGIENTEKPLKLVVNTEAVWAVSDPKTREKKSEQSDEEYASLLESIPVDVKYYQYFVEYAKILKDNNVKWTLSIGHIPPDWIKKEFNYITQDFGHSLPMPPNSQAWRAAKPWIEGLIISLKDFIGNGNTIEEIFIINEMMFSENENVYSEDDLKSIYLKLRNYILDSLKENGILNVKVSWKFVGDFSAMRNRGLSDKIMEDLLPKSDYEDYERTNLIGINLYEGQGLLNKDGSRREAKYACMEIPQKDKLQSDTYNVITHYTGESPTYLNFNGDIYFTEYGTPNTIPSFDSDELTNCIQYSFDNGVTYWAFYKWNDIRNISIDKNKEIIIGLANAFKHLLYAFPDVPISSKYWEAITELRKIGVLNGNPDGTFKPDDDVNRAEFTKMLVLAVRYATHDDINEQLDPIPAREGVNDIFFDVELKSWYEDLVYEAYKADLVDGYKFEKTSGDTAGKVGFGPENKILRCEAVKMVADAFKLFKKEDVSTYIIPSGFKRKYNDIERGSWYENYVARCDELGIMGEYAYNTKSFGPAAAMRKDEAAALIYNAYLKSLDLR